jgi:hypothetical protein
MTAKNIKAGFAACGLFPFNPDRVLNSMPKPAEETSMITAGKAVIQTSPTTEVPQTPVTPVSQEVLILLRNLILKQDAHALDDKNKAKLMSVPTGRKTQYAGKSDKCSTPTLAALEEQYDKSIASFESDGSSRC